MTVVRTCFFSLSLHLLHQCRFLCCCLLFCNLHSTSTHYQYKYSLLFSLFLVCFSPFREIATATYLVIHTNSVGTALYYLVFSVYLVRYYRVLLIRDIYEVDVSVLSSSASFFFSTSSINHHTVVGGALLATRSRSLYSLSFLLIISYTLLHFIK